MEQIWVAESKNELGFAKLALGFGNINWLLKICLVNSFYLGCWPVAERNKAMVN